MNKKKLEDHEILLIGYDKDGKRIESRMSKDTLNYVKPNKDGSYGKFHLRKEGDIVPSIPDDIKEFMAGKPVNDKLEKENEELRMRIKELESKKETPVNDDLATGANVAKSDDEAVTTEPKKLQDNLLPELRVIAKNEGVKFVMRTTRKELIKLINDNRKKK